MVVAGQARRPRAPPPGDHRLERNRRAADGERRRPVRHHLQRRDLQFPGAARPPARAGSPLPRPLRHRGAAAPLRRQGAGDGRRSPRHVRVRDFRRRRAHAVPRPRPLRRQTALLRRRRLGLPLRFAGQGAAGRRRRRATAIPPPRSASISSAIFPSRSRRTARSAPCPRARRSPSIASAPARRCAIIRSRRFIATPRSNPAAGAMGSRKRARRCSTASAII